jgi:predicted transcriptional regulator
MSVVLALGLRKLMVEAGLSIPALARASGLPVSTVKRALAGDRLSDTIWQGLEQTCREEIDANAKR